MLILYLVASKEGAVAMSLSLGGFPGVISFRLKYPCGGGEDVAIRLKSGLIAMELSEGLLPGIN